MTVAELVEAHLAVARADECNAFAALCASQALADAAVLDRLPPAARGPLHGLPVTIKDLFNVYGMPTVAGTRAPLPALWPPEAVAVSRLRAAGAVVLGKTNMHEIALGITGENAVTGDVCNPLDPARMSGGSSSGSAAAVRMGAGLVSLGTDTAGSIRLPASFCGVVGFRPTHGRVPLDGALALSPSLDTAGPLATTVSDARRVAEVLIGSSLRVPALDRVPRFGFAPGFLEGLLSSEVRRAFFDLLGDLLDVKEVALPSLDSAKLQVEVGWPESALVHEVALSASPSSFSPVILEALLRGRDLAAGVRERAASQRRELVSALDGALRGVDALIMPAAPVVAPVRGVFEVELESGVSALRSSLLALLVPFSMAGLPVVSLPFCEVGGLPVNVQIVTGRGEDALCLALAEWFSTTFPQPSTPTFL